MDYQKQQAKISFAYNENIYAAYVVDPKNNVRDPIHHEDIINRTEFRKRTCWWKNNIVVRFFFILNESYSEPKGLNKKGEFKKINFGVAYQLTYTSCNNLSLD